MQRQLDGGLLRRPDRDAAAGNEGTATMVFVDSELLGNLVLTAAEAAELSTALADAAAEGLPPSEGSLEAFRHTFGRPAPKEHSRTAADLQRHV